MRHGSPVCQPGTLARSKLAHCQFWIIVERYEPRDGGGVGECVQPAASVPEAPCNGPNTESCSDNLSIIRTVESLLATAVNRCVGRICNLAETRAPRPVREGQPEAQALSNASKLEVFCLVQNTTRRGIRHRLTDGWQSERGRQHKFLHRDLCSERR